MRRSASFALCSLLLCGSPTRAEDLAARVRLVAGGGPNDVPALGAAISVFDMAGDTAGNLYFSGPGRIWRIDPTGHLTIFAGRASDLVRIVAAPDGSGDGGPALLARTTAFEIAIDADDNLFFSEPGRVRRIDASTGIVTSVAGNGVSGWSGDGGPATAASILAGAIALGPSGDLYIAGGSRVRRVDANTGFITTIAGNGVRGLEGDGGPARLAVLGGIGAIAVDGSGNVFTSEDSGFSTRIRRIDGSTGIIESYAGGGASNADDIPAREAHFVQSNALGTDPSGGLYISDRQHCVRRVDAGTLRIRLVAGICRGGSGGFAGDGDLATAARLNEPAATFLDARGDLFVLDRGNRRIRRVDAISGIIDTIAGGASNIGDGGPATNAVVRARGVVIDSAGDLLFSDGRSRIRRVDRATGRIETLAGGPPNTAGALDFPGDLVLEPRATVLVSELGQVRRLDPRTGTFEFVTTATSESGVDAPPIALGGDGRLYVTDFGQALGGIVRALDLASGVSTHVAGDGSCFWRGAGAATSVSIASPLALAVAANGDLFIGTWESPCDGEFVAQILRVDARTQQLSILAGRVDDPNDPPLGAEIYSPDALLVTGPRELLALDASRLLRIDLETGSVETLLEFSGTALGLTADPEGNLYVALTSGVARVGLADDPPLAVARAEARVECSSPDGARVRLDGSASSDPDPDDAIALHEWLRRAAASTTPLGTGGVLEAWLPLGVHALTLRVTDGTGLSASHDFEVEVVDTTPPSLGLEASPARLWPPNHRLTPVRVGALAEDRCGPAAVQLFAVTSSEPDDARGGGDGHTTGDIADVEVRSEDLEIRLRAERARPGPGRRYTLTYRATDSAGNDSFATTEVVVPDHAN